MSDTPQGANWWQASDGRWYPPEAHPAGGQAGAGQAGAGQADARHPANAAAGHPGHPPSAAGSGSGRGKVVAITVLATVAVVALAGLGVFAAFAAFAWLTGDEAAADVLLEPADEPGPDPFTAPVAPEPAGSLLDYVADGAPATDDGVAAGLADEDMTLSPFGYSSVQGAAAGLYGGSLDERSCDPDQLVDFLAGEPDKARAFADVLGIDTTDIPTYVEHLTSVNLGADTRVVNHGFDGTEATPREAVLQRGTAVLVDRRGVPRVKCYCGNPLLEPAVEAEETYVGQGWPAFDPEEVLVVEQAVSPIEEFELVDIATGGRFHRPAGSHGDSDASAEGSEPEVVADDPEGDPDPEPTEPPDELVRLTRVGSVFTWVDRMPPDPPDGGDWQALPELHPDPERSDCGLVEDGWFVEPLDGCVEVAGSGGTFYAWVDESQDQLAVEARISCQWDDPDGDHHVPGMTIPDDGASPRPSEITYTPFTAVGEEVLLVTVRTNRWLAFEIVAQEQGHDCPLVDAVIVEGPFAQAEIVGESVRIAIPDEGESAAQPADTTTFYCAWRAGPETWHRATYAERDPDDPPSCAPVPGPVDAPVEPREPVLGEHRPPPEAGAVADCEKIISDERGAVLAFPSEEGPGWLDAGPAPVLVEFLGCSNTFEANVVYEIFDAASGALVVEGFTTGGTFNEWAEFRFEVTFENPGDYRVDIVEYDAASGERLVHASQVFTVGP